MKKNKRIGLILGTFILIVLVGGMIGGVIGKIIYNKKNVVKLVQSNNVVSIRQTNRQLNTHDEIVENHKVVVKRIEHDTNKINISNNRSYNYFKMAKSNGKFADITNGTRYLEGSIKNDTILVPIANGKIVNNQLVTSAYYESNLNKRFTLKISSTGNNNFIAYEFYNNKHTGTFKLKFFNHGIFNNGRKIEDLKGTFTNIKNNKVTNITFWLMIPSGAYFTLMTYPFYNATVGNAKTTLMVHLGNIPLFEKYSGNNNIFKLKFYYVPTTLNALYGVNLENKMVLQETFNGATTGYYILNSLPPGDTEDYIYKGDMVVTSNGNIYPIVLKGSYTPN